MKLNLFLFYLVSSLNFQFGELLLKALLLGLPLSQCSEIYTLMIHNSTTQ